MHTISFKPRQVSKRLLAPLGERARDVVISRFGLGDDPKRETLEAIGERYGITRERVRQIEGFAFNAIKKSSAYEDFDDTSNELYNFIYKLGALISEDDLLDAISKDPSTQNHARFILVLGEPFEKKKEDKHFKHRWSVDESISKAVHQGLHMLYEDLDQNDLVAEPEIFDTFKKYLKDVPDAVCNKETLTCWLNLSKVIGQNPLGEWGLASSPNIRARGIRDYAYLVIRRHGSPLHFTEVAKAVTDTFGRSAHVATCHNELIKDKERFVLVGRGLYGLAEWGYTDGIVRDVIINILKKDGSMKKEELVDRVLKERYVKENTVVVNLQNKNYFKRDKNGLYALA